MVQVNEQAFADMLRAIEDQVASTPTSVVEYILVDRYMPASAVVLAVDEQGRFHVICAQEVIDAIPRAPFTGSSLSALTGIPVHDRHEVKD
jgi:hypothetical protein